MKYTVLKDPHPKYDMHPIQLDEGEFSGCQVVYGAVCFDEGEEPTLKFDYEIVNDYNVNKSQMDTFVKVLGDVLVQILEESLSNNEVVYKGGK